jgi:hypothetical protein
MLSSEVKHISNGNRLCFNNWRPYYAVKNANKMVKKTRKYLIFWSFHQHSKCSQTQPFYTTCLHLFCLKIFARCIPEQTVRQTSFVFPFMCIHFGLKGISNEQVCVQVISKAKNLHFIVNTCVKFHNVNAVKLGLPVCVVLCPIELFW